MNEVGIFKKIWNLIKAIIYLANKRDSLENLVNLQKEMEITKLEHQKNLNRYKLCEIFKDTYVYELKEQEANGEPKHYLCPTCFDKNQRSILQDGQYVKRCHTCHVDFQFKALPEAPPYEVPMDYSGHL